ncbi:PA14 domain-containing protein [Streptomyces sp. NPDC057582]|uniref:PA14 domain-containing protein n=1 Tax=Streptomyces sp. NPDC057582 TaxID=3346174 RepID=UPI0036847E42
MPQRFRAACATAAAVGAAVAGFALPSTAHAATTCADGVWKATYYPNTSFYGTPKLTTCDTSINENYGTGDPAGVTLPKDNFTVRWQTTRGFGSGGPFTFTAAVRDGIRVYLDGVRKIDVWKNVSTTQTKTLNLTVPKGRHTIRVDFVAFTGSANVKFAYAPRTTAGVDKVKPLAPTGVTAAYNPATLKATIRWSKNYEMDLAGYHVYRRTSGSSSWIRVTSTPVTGTTFTDTPFATGQTYYYEVRAVDKAGNASTGSTDIQVVSVDKTPPPAPTGLTAGNDPLFGVSLFWSSGSEGMVKYRILRASSPTGPFTDLGFNAGNGSADETSPYGKTSYYKVTATDAAGNTSQSKVLAFSRPLAIPSEVSSKNNEADNGGIEISWKVSKYAPQDFRVYRRDASAEGATPERITCRPYRIGNSADYFPEYACTDTSVVAGTTYSYFVTTVDSTGRESEPSRVTSVGRRDRTSPPAATGLTATPREYGTELKWDESPAPDVARYRIFRGTSVDDSADHELVASVAPGTTRFVDTDRPDGETWVYFVDVLDTSNNSIYTLSVPANVAHVTVTELDTTPSVEAPPGAPLTPTATAAGSAVELSWSADDEATGYFVSRWNPGTQQYEKLTTDPVTMTSYQDTTAATGTTHYYWVTSVHADGSESAPGAAWAIVPPVS